MQRFDVRAPVGAREHGLGARLCRRIAVDIPGVIGAVYGHFGRVAVAHHRDGAHVLVLGVRGERQRIVAAHGDGDVHLPVAEARAGRAHVVVFFKVLSAARTAAACIVRIPDAFLIHDAELELIAHIQVDGDGKFVLSFRLFEDIAVLPCDGAAVPADRSERPACGRTARDEPLPRIFLGGRPHRIDVGVLFDDGIKAPVMREVRRRIPAFEDEALLFVALVFGREGSDGAALFHFPLRNDALPVEEGHRKAGRLLRVLAGSQDAEGEHECKHQPREKAHRFAQLVGHLCFPPYHSPEGDLFNRLSKL